MISITKLEESVKAARLLQLSSGSKLLTTPTYFPAISGTQHNFRLPDLTSMVTRVYPRILVSAYDFPEDPDPKALARLKKLKEYHKGNSWIMLDSGIFESTRLEDKKWSFSKYQRIVQNLESDVYFAFDSYPQGKIKNVNYAKATMEGIRLSRRIATSSQCISVIHGFNPSQLLYVAKSLTKSAHKDMRFVGVPERDCGSTLIQRAKTILKLREILRSNGEVFLHILGCGHPVSMALYVYCGADSFDSLDWTEQFVERGTFSYRELSHIDLVNCSCDVCQRSIRPKLGKALLHNLLFYGDFSEQLQDMVRRDTLRDFLLEFVGRKILDGI
ncbi:MAG: hypothetical protein JRN54_07915 [Nitrososphaerota archaeon]|nr:hypothetical protein [Nitrososphaerota archaeon]